MVLAFALIAIGAMGFVSACYNPQPSCGDGKINQQYEECDRGGLNGFVCWANYGSSCTYCTEGCTIETITNYCGDGIKKEFEQCDDGNLVNGDGCSDECKIEEPPEPQCDHEIAVKYSYTGTFDTGIGISENDVWLEDPITLLEDETHSIKYRIDNKKEDDDNVHITVKLDNEILSEYDKLINEYHTKTIDLDTSGICGDHTISVEIESDGYECNSEDNYAERDVYIECDTPPEPSVCGNSILETGESCDDGNLVNGDGCSSTCETEQNGDDNGNVKLNHFVQFCDTNWVCSGWSECNDGVMTRNCVDKNNCDTEYNRPYEQTDCKVLSNVYTEKNNTGSFWVVIGVVVFVVLLVILITFFI